MSDANTFFPLNGRMTQTHNLVVGTTTNFSKYSNYVALEQHPNKPGI